MSDSWHLNTKVSLLSQLNKKYRILNKTTLVLGASEKEERYSNQAISKLLAHDHRVLAVGRRVGTTHGIEIMDERPVNLEVDTVTLYISEKHQDGLFHYLKALKPKRIIFNPGTENPVLKSQLSKHGIECINGCTLVMLSVGTY